MALESSRLLKEPLVRKSPGSVKAGDTIVVPLDAERMRPLPLWTALTQIIHNIAIAAAAVHSF